MQHKFKRYVVEGGMWQVIRDLVDGHCRSSRAAGTRNSYVEGRIHTTCP